MIFLILAHNYKSQANSCQPLPKFRKKKKKLTISFIMVIDIKFLYVVSLENSYLQQVDSSSNSNLK